MLKAGTIIGGRYQVRHLIADGGTSEVYLVEPRFYAGLARNQLALKRLLPELVGNQSFAQMFVQEARIMAMLSHENIVACYDFVEDKNERFMVLELVVGKEVGWLRPAILSYSLLDRTKMVLSIGIKVCEALAYVHNRLIHGDVSPQNIMITANGEVKLYDFGASRSLYCRGTHDDIVRGNWRYMSPEQKAGKIIGTQSDIYSLSLVLLEMLGYDLGLDKEKKVLAMKKDIFINEAVERFFRKSLAHNFQERFSTGLEALVTLKAISEQILISPNDESLKCLVKKSTEPLRMAKVCRARPTAQITSLKSLTALVVGFGVLVWIITVIGVSFFEPRFTHNLPYWSQEAKSIKSEGKR